MNQRRYHGGRLRPCCDKKLEDMQVEHIGGLLRLGQEQCRLLRLLADGRMNPSASEASGTLR
jgi:hypothetical protein